jgi:hypothetical protein
MMLRSSIALTLLLQGTCCDSSLLESSGVRVIHISFLSVAIAISHFALPGFVSSRYRTEAQLIEAVKLALGGVLMSDVPKSTKSSAGHG